MKTGMFRGEIVSVKNVALVVRCNKFRGENTSCLGCRQFSANSTRMPKSIRKCRQEPGRGPKPRFCQDLHQVFGHEGVEVDNKSKPTQKYATKSQTWKRGTCYCGAMRIANHDIFPWTFNECYVPGTHDRAETTLIFVELGFSCQASDRHQNYSLPYDSCRC